MTIMEIKFQNYRVQLIPWRIQNDQIYSIKDSYTSDEQKWNSEADKRYSIERYLDADNDTQIYIIGDFAKSLKKALSYEQNPPKYDLVSTNCAWIALEVLSESATGETKKQINNVLYQTLISHKEGYEVETESIIRPNSVVKTLKEIFKNFETSSKNKKTKK